MTAREELARIIGGKLITRSSMTETADAILAAGYRKPETINFESELIDVLEGSLLIAGRHVYRKQGGALMDLEVGLMSYEEALNEEGWLVLVHVPEVSS